MKQVILNITKDEEGKHSIIIDATRDDDTKIVKVINYNQITTKDEKFIEDVENLIIENYGGQ